MIKNTEVNFFFFYINYKIIYICIIYFNVGVPFSTLYHWCRQRFLASTDLALRSQLTEFVDHELVKWKRDADVLYVPVDVDILAQFYKQNEEDDE